MLTSTRDTHPIPPGVDTDMPTVVDTVAGDHLLIVRDEEEIEIHGRLIGFATSRRDEHTHPIVVTTPTERELTVDRDLVADPITVHVPRYVRAGERCSACRWFEVRIFLVDHEYGDDCDCDVPPDVTVCTNATCGRVAPRGRYLVLTYGLTIVPGETHKRRAAWTSSPYEIIEILTQRNQGKAFLPATSAQVIAQAAACDRGIETAYVNRAVV